jgi:DNA-binding SARP family transcriptional activator
MDFHILGPIEAIEADRPLALGGSKQRALLGMLLLHAGEVVSTDRLLEELWPGVRREEALRALQVAVSRLRKALEPGRRAGADSRMILTRPPGYELRVDPEQLDAKRFEALVDEGRRALLAGDSRSARARLGEALGLWRGPPLADLAYESFCQAEVARLEELRVVALEERIAADLALGRPSELVGELRALVREEPLRERLRAHLMLALYRSGRQAEALDAYTEARRTLVEELGIEPSRELRELHQAILEQDAALDVAAREEAAEAPSSERERVTATFLFADIEGSTRLLAKIGRGAYERVLADFYGLMRAAVSEANGREVGTRGDGVFVAFSSAADAVVGATAAQRSLAAHAWPAGTELRVRMGIHTGEATLADGDFIGLAVHRAARICAAAHGAQVLLSQTTRDVAEEDLPAELGLCDLGEHHLKDLERPERLFQLQIEGMRDGFPPPRTMTAGLPAAAASEQGTETPGGVFVGREAELAELLGGLDDVFAGRGRLFLVAGEPGIGKSRLAEELIRHAKGRGARVLVGRCWEAGGAPAYWPWVQSLRAYVRESDDHVLRAQLGEGALELAQFVPELRARLPDLREPPAGGSEAARFRLFDATAEFLRSASQSRPILLLLDDLHAADAPSLLLLEFLARELASMQVLLVAVYRDVDPIPGQSLTETLGAITREPVTGRLTLDGLTVGEVAKYVEATAAEIASAELVAALHAETDGNPLFVGEIVRLLSVEGVPAERTGEVRLAIPQSVRDVIARRLTHLSQECRRILVLASVIGREFALEALARVAGVSEDELLDALDEAMAARVVSDIPVGIARLRFAHILIRDTLYGGLTAARRVRVHRLVVEALEALYGDEPGPHLAELAYHSVAGRELDKGLRYAWRAGDRGLALLAYEESTRLYRLALDALDLTDQGDDRARCDLLLSLGEAEARTGNPPAAESAFLEAARIARDLRLPGELAQAAAGYGGRIVWARAGDDDRLVPLLEEGLAALGEEDVELRARLLARLAGALRDEHTRDRRDALSRQAVQLARRTGNAAALAYALDGRAAVILAPDTVMECHALGSELCKVAERIGDKERVAAGHSHRIIAQLQVGDVQGAEADLSAAGRIAEELRQPAQLWQYRASRAMLALAAGKLGEAEELIAQAWALGERAQPTAAMPVYRLQRCTLCDFRDTLEEVEPDVRDLAAEYPARVVFRCALALIHARLGRTGEAERALHDLAAHDCSALPFDQEWLYGMSLLAETCARLGHADSAPVLYPLLAPWAALNVADVGEGIRGSASRYLGLLATITRSWEQAELHFEDALEMNARMGARPWLAHTANDYARMLSARNGPGDRERAQTLLDTARQTYHELGMESCAARAAALADKVGPTA